MAAAASFGLILVSFLVQKTLTLIIEPQIENKIEEKIYQNELEEQSIKEEDRFEDREGQGGVVVVYLFPSWWSSVCGNWEVGTECF